MRIRLLSLLVLGLAACEPPPSNEGAASPASPKPDDVEATAVDPGRPKTTPEEDAAQDPRIARRKPRPRALMIRELGELEKLLAASPKTSPDRAALLRRLAEGYVELEVTAKKEGATRGLMQTARRKAIERYRQIVDDHPTYASMDEVLYNLGLAYEASGDLKNARSVFYDLIKRFPESPFAGRAYYAFGVMFREDAKSDPSKWSLADQAFKSAIKGISASDPLHDLAVAQQGEAASKSATASPSSPSPSPSPAPSAAPAPVPASASQLGTDGTYVAEGGNYRLQAKFEPGKITITEPNKVSVYVRKGDSRTFELPGTEFALEVGPDGKSLDAFKTSSAGNRTTLTLTQEGAPSAPTGKCGAGLLEINVQNDTAVNPKNERLFGAPYETLSKYFGTYETAGAHPVIELGRDGSGVFEMHAAYGASQQSQSFAVKWWLQANCDGSLVSTTPPGDAKVYAIIFELTDPKYTGPRFQRKSLVVRPDGSIFILDRKKKP